MKSKLLFAAALLPVLQGAAQNVKIFDIFTYSAPAGFTLKENNGKIFYERSEGKNYCQLFLFPATAGTSDVEKDFTAHWNFFARNAEQGIGDPVNKDTLEADGWKVIQGGAGGSYGGQPFLIAVTTFTKGEITFYTAAVFTSQQFLPAVEAFMGSITPDLKKYVKKETPAAPQPLTIAGKTGNDASVSNGFQFTRTDFDDGWVSIPKQDWVETTKGNIKLLIHYPNKTADEYNPDGSAAFKKAWDILVAPRYSNASNMFFKTGYTFESTPNYGAAEMTENATGKRVYVVFFQRTYFGSNNKYVEIVAPGQAAFEQQFGSYDANKERRTWDVLSNLQNYNKFAVAASDLTGTWTTDFGAAISYVYVATGLNAGTDTYSSAESFRFLPGNTYEWKLSTASGMVGNIKFQGAASNGSVTMPDNWHIRFSDISGKPKTSEAIFTCIRGLRILWLDGKPYAKKE